jgi:hypothetical protein
METAAPAVQVSLPFDVLTGMVIQLDTARLRALRRAVDDTLAQREQAEVPSAEGDLDPGAQATIERSRAALQRSREAQEEISRAATELLKLWGIDGLKPVGPERLREMMRECGIREEDNEFSREIIAMREE